MRCSLVVVDKAKRYTAFVAALFVLEYGRDKMTIGDGIQIICYDLVVIDALT